MRHIGVALTLITIAFSGCGDDGAGTPSGTAGAALSACPTDTGAHYSIQYTECGGKRLNGVYCVTDCIYNPGDQSALPLNCTLLAYGPPHQTGVCVGSCSECQ